MMKLITFAFVLQFTMQTVQVPVLSQFAQSREM